MFWCPECLAELGARVMFNDAISKLVHRMFTHYLGYIAFAGIATTVLSTWLWNKLSDS
jgi:hypothetical protein